VKDNTYSGTVNNVPEATNEVKYGDTVLIYQDKISDWMFIENGKLRGGFTIRVLCKKMTEGERQKLFEESGFIIED